MKIRMMTVMIAATLLCPLAATAAERPPPKMCSAWFDKADRNDDGTIGHTENAAGFLEMITRSSANSDSNDSYIMSQKFFLAECAIGSFGMKRG